jgi:hypothetical protein
MAAVLDALTEQGYRRAVLRPGDFHQCGDSLCLTLRITSGPQYTICRWELAGVDHTDTAWVRRVLGLRAGVAASEATWDRVRGAVAKLTCLAFDSDPQVTPDPTDSTCVVRLFLRESRPAAIDGALAAGSQNNGMRGHATLGLSGLFRRDRQLLVHFEQTRPDERLMRLRLAERYTLLPSMLWSGELEDWRWQDHRQSLALQSEWEIDRSSGARLQAGARWVKLAPLVSGTDPTRVYELSLGGAIGRERNLVNDRERLMLAADASMTFSQQRFWEHNSLSSEHRSTRSRLEAGTTISAAVRPWLIGSISSHGRWWNHPASLAGGDEWFLGGAILRGYPDREIAAADGAWARAELVGMSASGAGLAVFGERAWLTDFVSRHPIQPASFGLSILLAGRDREGRLDVAWRDRGTLHDGLLRLSVSQAW